MSAPEPFMYESGTYYWSGHVDKFAAECETCETYGSVLEIFLVAHTHVRRVRDYEDGCIEDGKRFFVFCDAMDDGAIHVTAVDHGPPDYSIERDHCTHRRSRHIDDGFRPYANHRVRYGCLSDETLWQTHN